MVFLAGLIRTPKILDQRHDIQDLRYPIRNAPRRTNLRQTCQIDPQIRGEVEQMEK